MPMEYTPADRRRWLELYESGKTEKGIAMSAGCDVRTIKRGIAQAKLARNATDAKADLVKEALREHQADLLKLTREIGPALKLPPEDLTILASYWKGDRVSIRLDGVRCTLHRGEAGAASVTLDAETRDKWELLQEHLRDDPLWAALAQWKKALVTHLLERARFDERALAVMQKTNSPKTVDNRDVPPMVSRSLGFLVIKTSHRDALGIREDSSLEKDNDIDATTGPAAKGHDRPVVPRMLGTVGRKGQPHMDLLDAFRELVASSEAGPLADTYRALAEATEKAAKAAREVSLLGLILGECRICRRFGI